jgi:hypothetical protein
MTVYETRGALRRAALRELFTTVLGDEAGYVILDTVEGGCPLVVAMEDGTTLRVATRDQALRMMKQHFSWVPMGIEGIVRDYPMEPAGCPELRIFAESVHENAIPRARLSANG